MQFDFFKWINRQDISCEYRNPVNETAWTGLISSCPFSFNSIIIFMNKFEDFFYNRTHRSIHKWTHYLDIYNKHFGKFVDKDIKFLEIGVWKGGSLDMWAYCFGENSQILGIDIEPECKNLEKNNIKIEIGDQSDIDFLEKIAAKYGKFDVILDDGSHKNNHQIQTLNFAFEHLLSDNGIYLVEDCHTSYFKFYDDGGYKNPKSFIEHTKNIIDQLNSRNSIEIDHTYFTKNLESIVYYDSIIVLNKEANKPNLHEITIENPSIRTIDKFLKKIEELHIEHKDI